MFFVFVLFNKDEERSNHDITAARQETDSKPKQIMKEKVDKNSGSQVELNFYFNSII